MEWQKAGRPSKKGKGKEKPEWLEQEWTLEERSILAATERTSTTMLAIAVVKQWIRDGKPRTEYEGIRPWIQIIRNSLSDKNKKETPAGIDVEGNDE